MEKNDLPMNINQFKFVPRHYRRFAIREQLERKCERTEQIILDCWRD